MVQKEIWGNINGKDVFIFHLKNQKGLSVSITNYGSTITAINCPDKYGNVDDIVLGFDHLDPYLGDHPYFGSTIGRYANRISNGKFSIDGIEYILPINNGPNCLHGGVHGFHSQLWDYEIDDNTLITNLFSPHLSEGFPGNLNVSVSYLLDEANRLHINYSATTDLKTHINLTDHSYFNLSGGKRNVLDHHLRIDADFFTPIDEAGIPMDHFMDVENTPFDFKVMSSLGDKINLVHKQLEATGGFDHNFVLNNDGRLAIVAEVFHPKSGRRLMVHTDEPGIQLYTSNGMSEVVGKSSKIYDKYYALCLETQHFPDSPNRKDFPSTILMPNETFHSKTIYEFGW